MLCRTKREPERKQQIIGAEALLKILVDLNLHNDRLIWSQFQTLIALQGATLIGGYQLRGTLLSSAVVSLGIVFLVLLYLFIERVQQNRDVNMPLVDDLLRKYPDSELNTLMELADRQLKAFGKEKEYRLRFSAPLPNGKRIFWKGRRLFVRANILVDSAFWLLLAVDLFALVLFPLCPTP